MDSRLVLPVNTVLDGSYRIVRVVGSGGFGITYEAEDINLGSRGRHQGILSLRLRRPRRDHERAAQVRAPQADLRLGPLQLPAGGAHAGALRASQHRARHARVRGQLHRLHGDALRAGRKLRGLAQGSLGRPPTQEELDAIVAPAARRPGDDARGELPASRHRPRQHHRARRRHARCCSTSAPPAAPSPR